MAKTNANLPTTVIRIVALMAFMVALGIGARYMLLRLGTAAGEGTANAQDKARFPELPAQVAENLYIQGNTQRAQNVAIRISNFYRFEGDVYTMVCVQAGRPGLWEVRNADLTYVNGSRPDEYGMKHYDTLLLSDFTALGPQDEQCMVLQQDVSENADLSSLTLTINRIVPSIFEGHACEQYNLLIENSDLAARGIEIECKEGPGYAELNVAKHPSDISSAQADELVSNVAYAQIDGPWVFTGSANQ